MLTFKIPKGMAPDVVAKTFAAYLLGAEAFDGTPEDPYFNGPYRKKAGDDMDWQLDHTNDYWLHIKDDEATLNWRYPANEAVVNAVFALFNFRYLRDR